MNPRGVRVVMDICPHPERHCVWCMWIDERWLCDCQDRLKKIKKCCDCPHNSHWERKELDFCISCALSIVRPNVPFTGEEYAQLRRMENDTIKKWEARH